MNGLSTKVDGLETSTGADQDEPDAVVGPAPTERTKSPAVTATRYILIEYLQSPKVVESRHRRLLRKMETVGIEPTSAVA